MKKPQYQAGRRHTHEHNLSSGAIAGNDNRQNGKVSDLHEHGEALSTGKPKKATEFKPKAC